MSDGKAGNLAQLLYTADEAASMLRVKPRWLKRQAAARKIPFVMLAGSYHFSAQDLYEIMRRNKVSPESLEPSGSARQRACRRPAASHAGNDVGPLGPRPSPRRLARDLASTP